MHPLSDAEKKAREVRARELKRARLLAWRKRHPGIPPPRVLPLRCVVTVYGIDDVGTPRATWRERQCMHSATIRQAGAEPESLPTHCWMHARWPIAGKPAPATLTTPKPEPHPVTRRKRPLPGWQRIHEPIEEPPRCASERFGTRCTASPQHAGKHRGPSADACPDWREEEADDVRKIAREAIGTWTRGLPPRACAAVALALAVARRSRMTADAIAMHLEDGDTSSTTPLRALIQRLRDDAKEAGGKG